MPAKVRMPRATPTPMPALAPVLRPLLGDEWAGVDDEEGEAEEEDVFGRIELAAVADARVFAGVAAALAVMMIG